MLVFVEIRILTPARFVLGGIMFTWYYMLFKFDTKIILGEQEEY